MCVKIKNRRKTRRWLQGAKREVTGPGPRSAQGCGKDLEKQILSRHFFYFEIIIDSQGTEKEKKQ